MGFSVLKVEMSLIESERGGRERPVKSGYSPNHRFDDQSYYIGVVEFDDDEWHYPGEKNIVTIKMLDSPNCRERLIDGFEWEITEGANVVGNARLLSIEEHIDTEE